MTLTTVIRRLLVVCALLGCGHERGHERKPAGMPALSEAPPAKLVPAVTASLAPAASGYVRVDVFGVDVPAPADADYLPLEGWAKLSWQGCELSLSNGARDPGAIVVGTLRLACGARGCGDTCQRIRPVPGGPATEPYPTEPALIELATYGGDNGVGSSNVLVWRDGTVQFDGERCPTWRARRGVLPATRVAELVDVLARGGFFDHDVPRVHANGMDEHEGGWLAVRDHVLRWNGATRDALLSAAIDRVHQAVGHNPCTP